MPASTTQSPAGQTRKGRQRQSGLPMQRVLLVLQLKSSRFLGFKSETDPRVRIPPSPPLSIRRDYRAWPGSTRRGGPDRAWRRPPRRFRGSVRPRPRSVAGGALQCLAAAFRAPGAGHSRYRRREIRYGATHHPRQERSARIPHLAPIAEAVWPQIARSASLIAQAPSSPVRLRLPADPGRSTGSAPITPGPGSCQPPFRRSSRWSRWDRQW